MAANSVKMINRRHLVVITNLTVAQKKDKITYFRQEKISQYEFSAIGKTCL